VEVAHDGEGRSGSSEVVESGRPELGLARGKDEKDEGTMAHTMKGSTRAHGAGKVVLHPPWRAAASCSSVQSRAREGWRERERGNKTGGILTTVRSSGGGLSSWRGVDEGDRWRRHFGTVVTALQGRGARRREREVREREAGEARSVFI